jgi:hypothetical protein
MADAFHFSVRVYADVLHTTTMEEMKCTGPDWNPIRWNQRGSIFHAKVQFFIWLKVRFAEFG